MLGYPPAMTVSAVPASTTESRAAALAMFEGQVPCLFQLTDPSCAAAARWVVYFAHEENTVRCDREDPWPVCDEHKKLVQASSLTRSGGPGITRSRSCAPGARRRCGRSGSSRSARVMDEREIRRAIHDRYKAKSAEARSLIAENGRLKARVRQLESMIADQAYIVELSEQVIGLRDSPPSASGPR